MDISDIEYVESVLKTSLREGDRIIIEREVGRTMSIAATVKKVTKESKADIRVGVSWETETTKFVIIDVVSDNRIIVATKSNCVDARWTNTTYTTAELTNSEHFPMQTVEVLEIVPLIPSQKYSPYPNAPIPTWPERVLPKTVPYDGVRPLPLEPFLTYSKNGEKNFSTASD